MLGAMSHEQAGLHSDEGRGHLRPHRDAQYTARIGVESAREIQRRHAAAAVVDRIDGPGELALDGPIEAGTEQSVDNDTASRRVECAVETRDLAAGGQEVGDGGRGITAQARGSITAIKRVGRPASRLSRATTYPSPALLPAPQTTSKGASGQRVLMA